jgi:hypothetical protein
MAESGPWRVNAPHVIAESVDGEVLIVNLLSGAYYSSDGVGDAAWAMAARGDTRDQIVSAIATQYGLPENEIGAAVDAWLSQVLADELMVEGAASPDLDHAPVVFPSAYAPPSISKYTDMEDLLLLDPVHEVDEVGWPVAGTPA